MLKPYRTVVTVEDSNQIILNDVPVQAGDRVEVVVRAQNDARAEIAEQMRQLLLARQALPECKKITDDDIAKEIDAYRNGK